MCFFRTSFSLIRFSQTHFPNFEKIINFAKPNPAGLTIQAFPVRKNDRVLCLFLLNKGISQLWYELGHLIKKYDFMK